MVVIDVIVWAATATEATLGVLLLTGWRPKLVGAATCLVLIVFGAAMAVSLGMESPLSCSVFSAASAAAAYAILGTTSPPHTTDTTPVKRNSERFIMKIVVIGGRGLIGSKVASKLSAQGHDVITASRRSGVDSLTGEGLADAVAGADVLVDVADSPLFDDEPVMHFFTTTTTNLLSAEQEAGVKHHVALSVVGAQIMPDSGYNTAKAAQENLIKDSGRPLTPAESIGRNLMRIVDWMPSLYALGVLSAILTKENKRLGDLLVGSLVVRESSLADMRPVWHPEQDLRFSSLAPLGSIRLSAEDCALIDSFLNRRFDLEPNVRFRIAEDILRRLKPQLTLPAENTLSTEKLLEALAYERRATRGYA